MGIDFSKLSGSNSINDILNPRDIFAALPDKNDKYQYLRDIQGEVLTQWFDKRVQQDNLIKMNTGSGKTIVGLLMLKSCLNEKEGPAVYVCPDKYLVQQAIQEANNLGIEVTEDPNNPRFRRGYSILIINIYKLINGKSVFGVANEGSKITIGSIVIDDAHACLVTAESQFTLTIESSHDCYKQLFELFKSDLQKQSEAGLLDIKSENSSKIMLVPFWAWIDKQSDINRILHEHINEDDITFKWPLISENLVLCNCVFSSKGLEIAPICLPIWVIPSLINCKRRIFMSATLSDDSILVSHFNIKPESIQQAITPSSASDIGDRMILIPQELNPDWNDTLLKGFIHKLAHEHNVVVIVPSTYRVKFWEDVSEQVLTTDNMQQGINQLKENHVGLTVLVNKYDGIDLPDKACRILVIDGLPDVRRNIDKLEESVLSKSDEILNRLIQRIEQGMGRGTRANNDYCVVILMGYTLTNRLSYSALEKFTPATKAQIDLSERLAKQLRDQPIRETANTIQIFLKRDKNWVKASKETLANIKYDSKVTISNLAKTQRKAYEHARRRQYERACSLMQELIKETTHPQMKGWLMQQLAMYTHFTDKVKAQAILLSGAEHNSAILHPLDGITYRKLHTQDTEQADRCLTYLRTNYSGNPHGLIVEINSLLDDLKFTPDTSNKFEQAMKDLAFFIGFSGQRPEKDYKEGPDVLWALGKENYLVIECKNGATTMLISKKDSSQLSSSINWFIHKYDSSFHATPVMIHPVQYFHKQGPPPPKTSVITTEKLESLTQNVKDFIKALSNLDNFGDHATVTKYLVKYHLMSNIFVDHFTSPFKVKQ